MSCISDEVDNSRYSSWRSVEISFKPPIINEVVSYEVWGRVYTCPQEEDGYFYEYRIDALNSWIRYDPQTFDVFGTPQSRKSWSRIEGLEFISDGFSPDEDNLDPTIWGVLN